MTYLITDETANKIYNVTNADNFQNAIDTFNRFYVWATETENKVFTDKIHIFAYNWTAVKEDEIYKVDF